MPSGSSGLSRDINLIRRRWWMFIPFLILGILLALSLGRVTGSANAVASIQLETIIHELFTGGDRGLRIFEAQSMTHDPEFEAQVLEATGLSKADYARYAVSLSPISVADGVSRGVLTVSISDENKAEAERLRDAFVAVFQRNYIEPDGLFRTRFIDKKQDVADDAEQKYAAAIAGAEEVARARGVSVDDLVRSGTTVRTGPADELATQEAQLVVQQAELQGVIAAGNVTGAAASSVLGTDVTDANASAAVQARLAAVNSALVALRDRKADLSDSGMTPDQRAAVDLARGAANIRVDAYNKLAGAQAAVASANSTMEASYTSSGGVAGTNVGRFAMVLAVTVVFGIIAIYLWEWLSTVRSHAHESLS